MAVSFVVQYPDRFALHVPMIRIAREELLHYQKVLKLIHKRKLIWERDSKDPYIAGLQKHMSTDRERRLLDRLVLGSVVEARGVERFALIAGALKGSLADFYQRLSDSESRHARVFLELAKPYFSNDEIASCLSHWLDLEATVMISVPPRAALH